MFNNKKGIELSVNFIVMLILAIAVFAGGLMFATKFFTKAESMRQNLDSETERQIEKLLDSGSPVVLPISTREIFRNKYDTFGLGVLAKCAGTYTFTVPSTSAFPKNKGDPAIAVPIASEWLSPITDSKTLEKNEKGKFLILAKVPAGVASGTYIFTIQMNYLKSGTTAASQNCPMDGPYDSPVQLMVKVP